MEELPGCQLTAMIPTPEPDVFAAVGNALAGLHRSEIRPPASWSPGGELAALERAMADVRLALPTLDGAIQSLLQMIERRGTELHWDDRAPIHANLFGDQILVDETGDVGIVDWDDLCLGDPLFDVGRLIAHIIFVARRDRADSSRVIHSVQALLDSYAKETKAKLNWGRLSWQIAVALLFRAKISALRPLPTTWIEDIVASLAEANRVLEGQSPWIGNGGAR